MGLVGESRWKWAGILAREAEECSNTSLTDACQGMRAGGERKSVGLLRQVEGWGGEVEDVVLGSLALELGLGLEWLEDEFVSSRRPCRACRGRDRFVHQPPALHGDPWRQSMGGPSSMTLDVLVGVGDQGAWCRGSDASAKDGNRESWRRGARGPVCAWDRCGAGSGPRRGRPRPRTGRRCSARWPWSQWRLRSRRR